MAGERIIDGIREVGVRFKRWVTREGGSVPIVWFDLSNRRKNLDPEDVLKQVGHLRVINNSPPKRPSPGSPAA